MNVNAVLGESIAYTENIHRAKMAASSSQEPTRIFLWIVVRSNSTVFTKCMTFVDGVQVWYEPYLACALNDTFYNPEFKKGDKVAEKMRDTLRKNEASEKMKAVREDIRVKVEPSSDFIFYQETFKYSWLKEQLEKQEPNKKFVFIKDHSFAIENHMDALPNVPCRHAFLIRHPRQVYTSFKDVISKRVDFDGIPWDKCHVGNEAVFAPVGDLFQIHHRVWKHFQKNCDHEPIVIDGHDLLSHPEAILPKFFEKMGIPFKESYLEWEESPKRTAETWKGSADFVLLEAQVGATVRAVNSSRFIAPKLPRGTPSKEEWTITPELKEYIEAAMPFYEEMYESRLKP